MVMGRPRDGTPEESRELWSAVDALLVERGWSSAELSRASGVSPTALSRWSRGERFPSHSTLSKVSEAFGLRPEDIRAIAQGSVPDVKSGSILPLEPKETALVLTYRGNPRFKKIINAMLREYWDQKHQKPKSEI